MVSPAGTERIINYMILIEKYIYNFLDTIMGTITLKSTLYE